MDSMDQETEFSVQCQSISLELSRKPLKREILLKSRTQSSSPAWMTAQSSHYNLLQTGYNIIFVKAVKFSIYLCKYSFTLF